MSNHLFKIFFIILTSASYLVKADYVFPKNANIQNTARLHKPRAENMEDLDLLKQKMLENKENSIIVFHADWCHHW
jgi:hypothetical protein